MTETCTCPNGPDHVFHSSMRLYVLVENEPKPGLPEWAEVWCVRRGDTEYMLTYVSPVDARLEQHLLNRSGKRYRIVPFDQLDPTAFIESHEGRINVCVVYGFAAHAGRLLADPRTGAAPLALGIWQYFDIPPERRSHFTIEFGEMHPALGRIFVAAGLRTHSETLEELADYAPIEIERIADDARQRIKPRIRGEAGNEFAIYDIATRRWRFAPLERIKTRTAS